MGATGGAEGGLSYLLACNTTVTETETETETVIVLDWSRHLYRIALLVTTTSSPISHHIVHGCGNQEQWKV